MVEINLKEKEVENLIPQKFPFIMVHQLISYSENQLVSSFTITEENIFTQDAVFQDSGIIEHMAQSVALHTGYQFFIKNEAAPTGYIGSIKKIDIYQQPVTGDTLTTTVDILHEFAGVTLVEILVKNGEEIVAAGQMKTVIASE